MCVFEAPSNERDIMLTDDKNWMSAASKTIGI